MNVGAVALEHVSEILQEIQQVIHAAKQLLLGCVLVWFEPVVAYHTVHARDWIAREKGAIPEEIEEDIDNLEDFE